MPLRLLCAGALAVTLVVATGTLSQADYDDDDCIQVRRRPCPPPAPCQTCAPTTTYCLCPYYDMGGIWYAERFEIPTGNCTNGEPVATYSGPASYCSGDACGCGIAYAKKSATEDIECLYLPNCIAPDLANPPGVPHSTMKLSGPHHLEITTINGEPVEHPTYVAFYHMRTMATGKPHVPFWIGFQCSTPEHLPGRKVNAVSEFGAHCYGVVRVRPGGSGGSTMGQNAKDILIRLTENGCIE